MANFPTYKEIAEKAAKEALDGFIYQDKTLREWVNVVEQWQELKETIIEARDGDGTGTQQEICKFLTNYMDELEKNVSGSENPTGFDGERAIEALNALPSIQSKPKIGRWILSGGYWRCSKCKEKALLKLDRATGGCREYVPIKSNFCPNCGRKMVERESEEV